MIEKRKESLLIVSRRVKSPKYGVHLRGEAFGVSSPVEYRKRVLEDRLVVNHHESADGVVKALAHTGLP